MASAQTVLPGLNGNDIAGKIENGQVYISLTDMAQDAGKSLNEYGLLQATKDEINKLASQAGVPRHKYYQIINEEIWAPEPLARDFGKWLDPRYDAWVNVLCQILLSVQQGDLLSKFKVSFATHRQREIQKAQSETFNQWVSREHNRDFSGWNEDVVFTKTGWTSAEWKEKGVAIGLSPQQYSSAPEAIYHIDPELAAELSLMKCLMVQKGLPMDEAHHSSREMRLAFQNESSAA